MKSIYLSSSMSVKYVINFSNFFGYFYVIEGDVPFYRIESISDNQCCLSIVMVGFIKNELEVVIQKNVLMVYSYRIIDKDYLYSNIVKRHFKYKIGMLENISIVCINLENGFLNIYLKRSLGQVNFSKCKSYRIEIKV